MSAFPKFDVDAEIQKLGCGVANPANSANRPSESGEISGISKISKGVPPDWNDHPDTPPTAPFTKEAVQAIKAGKAVPVWSAVLEEWLWFVRDETAKAKLVTEGCQAPIYTLGELAVVADMRLNSSFGSEDLKRVHAIKKKFGAAIEWPPKEAG